MGLGVAVSQPAFPSLVREWFPTRIAIAIAVYSNGVLIGEAKQFNAAHEGYDFPAPGSYTIKLTAPGYKDAQFVVNASDDAQQELARIDLKLQRQ